MAKTILFNLEINGLTSAIENQKQLKEAIKAAKKELDTIPIGSENYNALSKAIGTGTAAVKALRDNQREAAREFDATGRSGVGAYKQLSAELGVNRNRLKDLLALKQQNAVLTKKETDELAKLSVTVLKQDEALKKIDASAGQFQRNVGNYANSYKGLTEQLTRNRNALRDLLALKAQDVALTDKQEKEREQLTASIIKQEKALDDINKSLKETSTETKGIGKILALAGGSFGELGSRIESLDGKLGSLGTSVDSIFQGLSKNDGSSSFLSKIPIKGLASGIAAFGAAAALAFSYVRDITLEYEKQSSAVSKLTDLQGTQLELATAQVSAISDTFNEDFNVVLRAGNALTKEFGGSFTENLSLIESGFLSAANANGEFLDNVLEYSSQISSIGGSTEDLIEVLVRSNEEGIYSDKGIDTVKEAGLRIREQTETTRTALENAFGQGFTDTLLNSVNDGSKTVFEATKEVSKALGETELTAEQTGAVIADVFGGAGEDAGLRFIEILGEIDGDISDIIDTTDAYTIRQQNLLEANKDLREEQNQLAGAFAGTGTSLDSLTTKLKTTALSAVNEFVEAFRVNRRIIQEDGFFGAIEGGAERYKQELDELTGADNKAREEVEKGEKEAEARREALAAAKKKREDAAKVANKEREKQRDDELKRLEEAKERTDALTKATQILNGSFKNPSINDFNDSIKVLNKELKDEGTSEGRLKLSEQLDDLKRSLDQIDGKAVSDFEVKVNATFTKGEFKSEIENEIDNSLSDLLNLEAELNATINDSNASLPDREDAYSKVGQVQAEILRREKEITKAASETAKALDESLNKEKERLLAQAEFTKEILAETKEGLEGLSDIDIELGTQDFLDAALDESLSLEVRKDNYQNYVDYRKEQERRITENEKEENDKRVSEEKKSEERKKEIQDAALQVTQAAFSAYLDGKKAALEAEVDAELEAVEARYDREIKAAEGNSALQAKLQEDLEKEKAKIEKEAAKERKRIALIEAGIAIALAAIKALPNPIAVAAALGLGAIQLAVIANSEFEEGGEIQKDGTIKKASKKPFKERYKTFNKKLNNLTDSNGIIQGKRHNRGGEDIRVNGRNINVEAGEFADYDENGNYHVISRKKTVKNKRMLAEIHRLQFEGKGDMLRSIANGSKTFAMEGVEVPSVSKVSPTPLIPISQNLKLDDDSIEKLAQRLEAATYNGNRDGITDANEESILFQTTEQEV